MNIWLLDRGVILADLIVWLIFSVGLAKTAVPKRIGRLYSIRANLLAMLPFSSRWQQEIAPEHVDAYRKFRRWCFAGMTALLAVSFLQIAYFKFLFMKLHGFDLDAKNISVHVQYTDLRPQNDADKARAATLVTGLQHALAKYQDYRVAKAEGFEPFAPEIKLPVVDFWEHSSGKAKATVIFNPSEPQSLLYQPTPEGGYKLIGATFMAEKNATDDQLNEQVPLSVVRWHRDINVCIPGRGTDARTADLTKFQSDGLIATKQACDAVGGHFFPVLSGWTVEVHPWEQNPKLMWQQ